MIIKIFTLMLSILMTIASLGSYVFLDAKITAGERQISDGQKEIEKEQPVLDKGKAKLEAGKIALAEGKAEYEKAHSNLFKVFIDNSFNHGRGFEDGRKQIAEGDKQVAQGEAKISAGEKRLSAGELELNLGKDQLKLAKDALIACALSAIIFGVLSIALAILWRRSLALIFK